MTGTMRRTDDIVTAPLDDTLLMMSIEQGCYFGLNGVGPRIWDLLAGPITREALLATLLEEFEVTPQTCAAELDAFLDQLRASKLLIEDEG